MPESFLMALGDYRFSLGTAAYQSLRRSTEYRWATQERLQRRPALQYLGPGTDEITLEGTVYPFYRGGLGQIDEMRRIAYAGTPLSLVDGRGFAHGRWVIRRIEETQRYFLPNGAPRRIDFSLRIAAYGEDRSTGPSRP